MSRIGERLRAAIPTVRGEQKAVAFRAGVSPEALNKILTGKTREPGFETIARIARAAGLDLNALDDEAGREIASRLTPYDRSPAYRRLVDALEEVDGDDRAEIIRRVMWDAARASKRADVGALAEVIQFPERLVTEGDFPPPPIPPDEWKYKDTDRPQQLHARLKPIRADVAAGRPSNPDDDTLIPTAQLLNSIREIRDPRVSVIRVAGHSMHPVLRNGWLVLIDPARDLFQLGRVVMVYVKDEGTTLGLLAKTGSEFRIVKRNPDYGGPMEIRLPAGEWYPIGTVTRVVDAPVEVE